MAISTNTYAAVVTFNQDPDKRGVIRVACAGLLGDEDTEVPMDIEPALDWGWFYVPDIGEVVEIEVVEGASEDEQFGQASIDSPDIKWRGVRYANSEGKEPRLPHEMFTEANYGKRRGFHTPSGHVFMFDDTEGKEQVTLSWKDGSAQMTFDKDGSFTVNNKAGATITMDAVQDKIIATAGTIEMNGAEQSAVLGELFKAFFDLHGHVAPMGLTGPPTISMTPDLLNTTVKVG